MNIMKRLNNILLYLHQLPQNIIGFLITKILHTTVLYVSNGEGFIKVYSVKQDMFVSLGDYIIVNENYKLTDVLHEYGHHLQSVKLGWLYLFVIGIPSFIGCGIYLIKRFDYFNLPWEKWADELGGVNR